jgi:hypothetical protein
MTATGTLRSVRNVAGKQISGAAKNAREEISGRIAANKAVGKAAVDRARNVAGAARQVAGIGKRAVRRGAMGVADTVSTATSKAVKSGVRKVRNGARKARNVGRILKDGAKAAYYVGTKRGRQEVADRTREAKRRTYNRRQYGNG